MEQRHIEIAVGLFMVAGLAALLLLAFQISNMGGIVMRDGYIITASFQNTGGLKIRAPVTVSGVRVGRVEAIDYDAAAYEAVVRLRIDARYDNFPADTFASIYTSGLLGEQYIALEPGGSEEILGENGHIQMTQSALVLEQVVGQFLFGGRGENLAIEPDVTGQEMER